MPTFLTGIFDKIREYFAGLSKKEKTRMAILAVVVIALSITVALILGRVDYGILYSGLTQSEAGDLITALEEQGVQYKTQGTDTILVPADRVTELRMRLSASGYMSDAFNFDIFSNSTGFGTTDLEKQTYLQYQLQEFIRVKLLEYEKVDKCHVIVNLPKESTYVLSSGNRPASCTVTLSLKGGGKLSQSEVNAMADSIQKAVPGLTMENISLTDTSLNLYTVGDVNDIGTGVNAQMALEESARERITNQVITFLSTIFGGGNVKALVNVTLNFDKENIQKVEFAPPVDGMEEGLIVSMSELYENSRYTDGASGVPGTDSNGIGTVEYPVGTLGEDELYSKVLREMNYEINEVQTQIEKARGTTKDLSIAILINSEAISEDYTDNVVNLVANAIGVNDTYISVERLPFQDTEAEFQAAIEQEEAFMRSMQIREIIKRIITWVFILLLALTVLAMIRSIVRGIAPKEPEVVMADGTGLNVDYIAGEPEEEAVRRLADLDVNNRSEEIEQLEKLIDKDPEVVAQLLRNWLSDDL